MFHEFLYLSLLFSFVLSAAFEAEEKPCVLQDGSKIYDLNSLAANKDYIITTPGNSTITLNICRPVISEAWNLKDVDQTDNVGGFIRKDRGDFSIGRANTTIALVSQDPPELPIVKMTFSQGSKCSDSDSKRGSSTLNFICAPDSSQSQPRLVAQLPEDDEEACLWAFEWKTKAVCAKSSGGGFGSLIASILSTILILALLYLILGILYNRYILKLTGMNQIPQFSVESAKYHFMQVLFWGMDWWEHFQQRRAGGAAVQGQTNPVSHHAQSQPDPTPVGDDGFGFVRPNPKTNPKTNPAASKTNPFSHQSAVMAAQSRAKEREQGTREEREFMLGDSDEDDDEPERIGEPQASSETGPQPSSEGNAAVELRGRATEEGDIVRL